MSIPDDRLFWIAVFVLCLMAVYELWWTGLELGARLWAALHSLRGAATAARPEPGAVPTLATVPVAVIGPTKTQFAPTRYLETMSPEEMDRFLAEPGV